MAMATSASHIAIHEQVELTVPDDAERALKLLKNFDLAKFVQLHRPLVASSGIVSSHLFSGNSIRNSRLIFRSFLRQNE